jgi:hypothetical protein
MVDVDFAEFAEPTLVEEFTDDVFSLEAEGAGDDLGDEMGMSPCCVEHATSLGGVEGQSSLSEDVFAGFEGSEDDGAVQVGPGADHDGVEVAVGDEVLPMLVSAGDGEFAGDGGGRSRSAIADSRQFYAWNGEEPGNVPQAGIVSRSDESDA